MKNQQNKPLMKKLPMLVLSLAVFILIISCGYFYYRYEKKILRKEQYSNLRTIADLKIDQITNWREERLADAQVIAESPFIRQNFSRWLLSQDSTLGKDLLERFALLKYNYKYEDVIIVSDGGKLLLGLNTNRKHIDSETIDYCNKAFQDKKAFLSDFYFSPAHDTIHLDIFAPILNDKNVAVAVLVLRVNPYDYLYPLIQSWPTSSKSAETLIIRRDGDSILYENELRHISNTALKLRVPLTSIKVPAVQAVLGHIGIFEGLDYRGVRVLSDIRPVPGTPWFMIAKVDQIEIFSELKYRTEIVIIITLLLLLFFGIGISWLYNNRQKNIYRKLLETGTALQESEVKYRSLFENAEVGMYRSKLDGTAILAVNRKLCGIFGFNESEMLDNPATICWADADARSRMVENLLKEGSLHDYEMDILTKSSEIRTLSISVNLFPEQGYLEGSAIDITERKQAEKVIRDNEKRFRELIESLPQLFWTCRVDGPCDYLSKQWVEYTGVPETEQLGYRWLEQLHPEDRDGTVSRWMEKVKKGESFDIEFRIRRIDTVYHWFKTRAVPMRNAEGNIIKWFGSNTDIDEIKKAEGQLRKLNRIYSLLSDINQAIVRTRVPNELFEKVCNIAVEQGGFGMAWIGLMDESSQKLQVIAQAGRTNGYHEQINISLNCEPLSYCPIDSALRQGKHNICNIIENEQMAPCQKIAFELGFRSSASFPLKVSDILKGALTFYSDEQEFFDEAELKLLDELALDISFAMEYAEKEAGRKRGEEALLASEARYKTLVENIPQKIFLKGRDFKWVSVNENLARDLGISPEEVIGKMDYELFSSELADKYHADDVRIIKTGKTEEIEEQYVVAGKETWVNTIKTPVRNKDGEIMGVLGIFWDITDRKLAEEQILKLNAELEDRVVMRTAQLEASNKELEAFSYSVSHDLRAPLRHVSGYVELLNKHFQSDLSEKGQHYLYSISDSVRQMGVLIDDLLQFSRTGRIEMSQSDVDMNEIVKEVTESLCKDNPDRKIEWVQGKLSSVYGDEAMLHLVWMNLLGNAVKFTRTRKNARIEIGVHEEKKELVFFVRDNGVGFNMQYAHKLFGVFQRLHSTEEFEGTGIGLANVHRIVLRHGGRTWAEAEPDKGAVFYFSIPKNKEEI